MHSPPSGEESALSRVVMSTLDEWGLSSDEILHLLCLPDSVRSRHLDRFRQGNAFPQDAGVMQRVEQVVGIAEALRTTYPRNAHMAAVWLNRPHRRFDQRTPLRAMVDDGLPGLIAIRSELDCGYAWDLSQAQPPGG
jgi:hypothetical protein